MYYFSVEFYPKRSSISSRKQSPASHLYFNQENFNTYTTAVFPNLLKVRRAPDSRMVGNCSYLEANLLLSVKC